MTKMKLTAVLVFIISLLLISLSIYIAHENHINNRLLNTINQQKAFTQEISKNIFYIYKNKSASQKQLNDSIHQFIQNLSRKEVIFEDISSKEINSEVTQIITLWNQFYATVQEFRDFSKISSPYTSIILEKKLKEIYDINIALINKFDTLMQIHQHYFHKRIHHYKIAQYSLFALLLLLLLYLFSQLQNIMLFISKFLNRSSKVLQNADVRELQPIDIKPQDETLRQATENFNSLISNIDDAITHAVSSIEHTNNALEKVDMKIGAFLDLLAQMEEQNSDDTRSMYQREDAIIQSLEELMTARQKLQQLRLELQAIRSSEDA